MAEEHILLKVTQKGLIVIDGKVLLVLEDGDWELPGGRVDEGETDLVKAFKRELLEELSIEVEPENIFTSYLFKKPTGEVALAIIYRCKLLSTLESINPEEGKIEQWKFFSKEELGELKNIYPTSSEAIDKFLS